MDVIKSRQPSTPSIAKVVVHPLVLLGVVDHYYRVAKDTRNRVIGVLLGSSSEGTVEATDSFAVPFKEDLEEPNIWYLLNDNYIGDMLDMLDRTETNDLVVGWYSTGPQLRENDLDINCLFKDYVLDPVLVLIDVQPKEFGIPTIAYHDIKVPKKNVNHQSERIFVHVPSVIAADEIEEIGVKHLLGYVMNKTIKTLEKEVTGKLAALKGLDASLKEINGYLDLVIGGKLPLNHEILYRLQDVFNLLPNLNDSDLTKAYTGKINDQMLVIYLSSFIRSVIALHNLLNNKIENAKAEDAEPSTVAFS